MKIKARHIIFSQNNTPYIIDNKGRIWIETTSSGRGDLWYYKEYEWVQIDLPDEPKIQPRRTIQNLPYTGALG